MDISTMKNMIILRNLPSNLADEAIIVLKENRKIKNKDLIDKKAFEKVNSNLKTKSDDYIIKEAESIVSEYLTKFEENKTDGRFDKSLNKKYKKIKVYSGIITLLAIISIIINFI